MPGSQGDQPEAAGPSTGGPGSDGTLQGAWIELLSRFAFQWFGTHTFREEVHPERADKVFRVWVSQINRKLYGVRWYKQGKGLHWCRALELQRRGVIHYHTMLGGLHLEDLRRLDWMDRWDQLAGYCRITPIVSPVAVRSYVSKYVIKGGEIDLGGALMKEALPLLSPLDHVAGRLESPGRPAEFPMSEMLTSPAVQV